MASTGNQFETLNQDVDEDFQYAMQLAGISVLPFTFQVALDLNVFGIIAEAGPGAQLSPKQIVSHLPTQNPDAPTMLDRVLRLLTSYSVLTSSLVTHDTGSVERLYGLAPVSKYFIPNEDGVSISPLMLLVQDKVFMKGMSHVKDLILQGDIPFNKAQGMHIFEYAKIDPRFNQVFNKGMLNYTIIFTKSMLERYQGFKDVNEVVDVGGGLGITINLIVSKYPSIKGINFDLPHVITCAPSYPGVEHIGGDMFESVPKAKTIFMKWILHDWSDKKSLEVLKNCYKALPANGKLIIVEAIIPVALEDNIGARDLYQEDIIMMIQVPGGKERTEKEIVTLAKYAGFISIKIVCCIYGQWVIEFYK